MTAYSQTDFLAFQFNCYMSVSYPMVVLLFRVYGIIYYDCFMVFIIHLFIYCLCFFLLCFQTYIYIFKDIGKTNIPTLIISLICIVILYLVKVQVNQRFKHKLKIPLPIELVVVRYLFSLQRYFKSNK